MPKSLNQWPIKLNTIYQATIQKEVINLSIQCPPGSFRYIIKAGDTLYQLAITYGATVQAIIALNPGLDPNSLQVGRIICIPGTAPITCPAGSFSYTIRSGDTLYSLAQRYGTTVAAITAINPGINPNALVVGQTVCIPGAAPITCPAGSFAYTIRPGDTLYSLALRYGTTVAAITAINPGINPNALVVGQTVCIPGTAPTTCPAGSISYTIKQGDTLYSIAQRYGTSISAILAINPGINPNALFIGQVICVPQATTTCPGGTIYTIQPGDTLYQIATKYDVSIGALLSSNPGLDPNMIIPGQRICIPAQPTVTCPGNNTYVIQPGETLSSIAEKFTVRAGDILVLNPGLRPSEFTAGRTICIPTRQAPV